MQFNPPDRPAPEPQADPEPKPDPATETAPPLWAHTPIEIPGVPPDMLKPLGANPEQRGFFYGGAVTAFMTDLEEGDYNPEAVGAVFTFMDEVIDHYAPSRESATAYKFRIRMAALQGLSKQVQMKVGNRDGLRFEPSGPGKIVDL